MRFRGWPLVFGLLGLLLLVLTPVACVTAGTWMPQPSEAVTMCAERMLSRLCAGDFLGASACCLGNPKLEPRHQSPAEARLWEAFGDSLSFSLVGESYPTSEGAAQDVVLTGLDIPSVTEGLRQRVEELLPLRIEGAARMAEVYEEDLSYREEFLLSVLDEAVEAAIREEGEFARLPLSLRLVHRQGQWLILPEDTLLEAVCGGSLRQEGMQ